VITGYNTDVKHDGKVFHVQTEDKGIHNPIIETLIYVGGGQIISSKQYNYSKLVAGGKVDERAVSDLLESQHRRMLRWVSGGKFDSKGPPPFGHTIVSGRSFDEVVLEFIRSQSGSDPIEIVVEEMKPEAGRETSLRLLVRKETSNAPAAASVSITLIPAAGRTSSIFEGTAGSDGRVTGNITLPPAAAGGTLLIEAQSAGQVTSVEVPVAEV